MAEGFEPYHVPQQSRRDKLRVLAGQTHPGYLQPDSPPPPHNNHHHHLHPGLLPPYDIPSSFISSSDLLTCQPNSSSCAVKEEGHVINHHLMGFVSNSNSSSSYLDPHSSNNFPLNPTAIQEINPNPFLYTPQSLQNLRGFDHQAPYPGHDQVVVFKPEPLALSLSSSQPTHHHHHHHSQHNNNNNPQRYGSPSVNYSALNQAVTVVSASNDHSIGSRSSVPLGPFTGYASILKGSRFLKPAQQLLEEFCDVGNREIYSAKVLIEADSVTFLDPPIESFNPGDDDSLTVGDGGESRRKKSRLITMLDEVLGLILIYILISYFIYLPHSCRSALEICLCESRRLSL